MGGNKEDIKSSPLNPWLPLAWWFSKVLLGWLAKQSSYYPKPFWLQLIFQGISLRYERYSLLGRKITCILTIDASKLSENRFGPDEHPIWQVHMILSVLKQLHSTRSDIGCLLFHASQSSGLFTECQLHSSPIKPLLWLMPKNAFLIINTTIYL